jgi:hypothetical protein
MLLPGGLVRAYSMIVVVLPDPATALILMSPEDSKISFCSFVKGSEPLLAALTIDEKRLKVD